MDVTEVSLMKDRFDVSMPDYVAQAIIHVGWYGHKFEYDRPIFLWLDKQPKHARKSICDLIDQAGKFVRQDRNSLMSILAEEQKHDGDLIAERWRRRLEQQERDNKDCRARVLRMRAERRRFVTKAVEAVRDAGATRQECRQLKRKMRRRIWREERIAV